MSVNHKQIKVGRGTALYINENDYIAIGKNGDDVYIRFGDMVLAFDSFKDLFDAIDPEKAVYQSR